MLTQVGHQASVGAWSGILVPGSYTRRQYPHFCFSMLLTSADCLLQTERQRPGADRTAEVPVKGKMN